jgi:hypothetical protein
MTSCMQQKLQINSKVLQHRTRLDNLTPSVSGTSYSLKNGFKFIVSNQGHLDKGKSSENEFFNCLKSKSIETGGVPSQVGAANIFETPKVRIGDS